MWFWVLECASCSLMPWHQLQELLISKLISLKLEKMKSLIFLLPFVVSASTGYCPCQFQESGIKFRFDLGERNGFFWISINGKTSILGKTDCAKYSSNIQIINNEVKPQPCIQWSAASVLKQLESVLPDKIRVREHSRTTNCFSFKIGNKVKTLR